MILSLALNLDNLIHQSALCLWPDNSCVFVLKRGRGRERQQLENGLMVVVVGRRCKQTVGKKATSYIIEGDVKASSLQGCQCQEAEPGWEQRAPPCLPLQRAAIYIVNTHSLRLCLSVCLSLCLILSLSVSFTLGLSHSVRLCIFVWQLLNKLQLSEHAEMLIQVCKSWNKIFIWGLLL